MPRSKAWKLAFWMLAIPPALCALLVAALVVAGWWVESRWLRRDIPLGDGGAVLRVHGGDFEWWALNFRADSVWFRSPALDARTGATAFRVDFTDGILALRPAVRLDADSLWLRLRADTAARDEATPLDSIVFPDFAVPIAVRVAVRGLLVEDDSGMVARVRGISLRNPGTRALRARVGRAQTRWTGDRSIGGDARLDWSAPDSVDLRAAFDAGPDTLRLEARHAKTPLWRGRDSLSLDVADLAPWLAGSIIGAPLGIMARRGGLGTGVIYSLAFFVLYWAAMIRGEAMADKLQMSPALAMWAPNLLVGAGGAWLLWRVARERYAPARPALERLRAWLSARRSRGPAPERGRG